MTECPNHNGTLLPHKEGEYPNICDDCYDALDRQGLLNPWEDA